MPPTSKRLLGLTPFATKNGIEFTKKSTLPFGRKWGIIYLAKKAIVIWNLAYDWGHSGGIMEICNYLDELMELAEKLLEKEETANGRKQ